MATAPDLTSYDWLVINSSAGKDSQAMLDFVVSLADEQGVARAR
jgi:predicted phosphoadenosine phosphosulfate sulfurtransferase